MPREIIDITPDKSLMPKLGHAGYSAPQAIAELVDNSIDAMIEGSRLEVAIKIGRNGIIVADNGTGMNKEEISKALKPAFSKKEGKLGEFGLGLKTSCLSLGDKFTVKSKATNENMEYSVQYDSKQWMKKTEGWRLHLESKEVKNNKHYTVVYVEDLKVYYPNLQIIARTDLQKRFSPFIINDEVVIKVNKNVCVPESHKLIEGTKNEFNKATKAGHVIHGWYALLEEGSNKGYYGFHTFRRNRMITTYDKIAIGEHPTISRIIGQIHMDHVPVTHNKREWIKESPEYIEAESILKEVFKALLSMARKKASQETVKDDLLREVKNWADKIAEALQSDEIQAYAAKSKSLSEVVRAPKGELKEEVSIEQRSPKEQPSEEKQKERAERDRHPKKKHEKKRDVIRIKGKSIEFRHDFRHLGEKEDWKKYFYEQGKIIEVFTNIDFPAYSVTKDKSFYAVIHIAETLAEILIKEANEDYSSVDDLKELILRKASELKSAV